MSAWRKRSRNREGSPRRTWIPLRFILEATIKQMQSFVDPSPGQNPFVTAFADKLTALEAILAAQREQLRAEAERIVGTQIYPAWKKAAATPSSPASAFDQRRGLLWRLKGGLRSVRPFLRRYTTTNLTADQIHEIGLQQVSRIETQMDILLRRLGRTAGSVKDRTEKLRLDLQYPNPTSDESRAQIMRDADAPCATPKSGPHRCPTCGRRRPVTVQPFPALPRGQCRGQLHAPAPDGSRPGVVQIPGVSNA